MTLTWSENFVLTDIKTQTATNDNPNANTPVEARESIDASKNATFKITDTKLFVPVVTLSTKDDNNFLEQLKSEFKITSKSNRYRSEITNQTKPNYLNYLIDPTFTKKKIDYLFCRLKMKKIAHLFESIMYQRLK